MPSPALKIPPEGLALNKDQIRETLNYFREYTQSKPHIVFVRFNYVNNRHPICGWGVSCAVFALDRSRTLARQRHLCAFSGKSNSRCAKFELAAHCAFIVQPSVDRWRSRAVFAIQTVRVQQCSRCFNEVF